MSEVVIVGGGSAGLWCAAGVVRNRRAAGVPDSDIRVTLIDAGDDIVIRPRLYEANPDRMRVALDRVLGPIGVRRIAATVTAIGTDAHTVTAIGRDGGALEIGYDRLVLAAGSRVVRPALPGAEHLFDVDQLPGAAALDAHLHRLPAAEDVPGRYTAVVIGAGFTGLEVATELTERLRKIAGADAPVRVVLVERSDAAGSALGEGPRPQIEEALSRLGIEVHAGVSVAEVRPDGVLLDDGTEIPTATAIWTAGMLASPLTAHIPGGRDQIGRLVVDEFFRVVGVPGVYAAGDTAAAEAEPGHTVMQSCQHAVPQGKFAGHNVAADLLGRPLVPFAPNPYVTCLDLGPAGAVVTLGWDRVVQKTGASAKQLKQNINAVWIYPPVDDAEALLEQADHSTTWSLDEVSA
ncbi:NAD(P)/FAD-dependent oxidoreductase [Pseudonocardia spinosispora]|uniref:NAD(P)/FAD-dependent oxidoreductase n=1 Tax=Pseudonocardia spinosispora TaxID=103441 RepID=UPI00041D1EFB|nr:FAD-dependent oxidoreductase [Pseudonocardia spinosispora]